MRITELTAHIVRLRLRKRIEHASHSRSLSRNIMVSCRLRDGTIGWGEGVPRSYVTGETPEGALAQFAATPVAEQLDANCDNWDHVFALCDRFDPTIEREDPRDCGGNSLRCAVELSILDAFGRVFGEPLSAVTHRFGPALTIRTSLPQVRYSGAVTAATRRKEVISAVTMRVYGFRHCKVKVGLDSVDETARLRILRKWLGPRMDIRLDANEAWHSDQVVAKMEPLLKNRISCLEQPVPHAEVDALADVRRELPVPVMLDESLTSLADAEAAIDGGTCDLLNIRLSKCGGFLNSLRIAAKAHSAGLGYQLGCHPGESGILSAAGRHWATSVRNIRYCEGSYDRHLLNDLVTNEDITFGYGGVAQALTGPGLGIAVNPSTISRLADRTYSQRVG